MLCPTDKLNAALLTGERIMFPASGPKAIFAVITFPKINPTTMKTTKTTSTTTLIMNRTFHL